jgi:hypothetical protein
LEVDEQQDQTERMIPIVSLQVELKEEVERKKKERKKMKRRRRRRPWVQMILGLCFP